MSKVATKQGSVAKHPGGRPSTYNPVIAQAICERIMNGESLRAICNDADMPERTVVHGWLARNEEFSHQYALAREQQADTLADDMMYIADTATDPYIARLRVDTRKWIASKLKPKKYGDKLDLTTDGQALPQPITALQVNITDGIKKVVSDNEGSQNRGEIQNPITTNDINV